MEAQSWKVCSCPRTCMLMMRSDNEETYRVINFSEEDLKLLEGLVDCGICKSLDEAVQESVESFRCLIKKSLAIRDGQLYNSHCMYVE